MADWGFWEWLAYGGFWIGAIILAIETGLAQAPASAKSLPPFFRSARWGFVPLILMSLSAVVFLAKLTGFVGEPNAKQATSRSAKILLETGNKEPFISVAESGTFAKLRVTNIGSQMASCHAYLVSLRRDDEYIIRDDQLELWPSHGQNNEIAPGAPSFFDIAYVPKGKSELSIASTAYKQLEKQPLYPWLYKFHIQVSGRDCGPVFKDVWISFHGTAEVSVIDDGN